MRSFTKIGSLGFVALGGCNLLDPPTAFEMASSDRPVQSASLNLCHKIFPLVEQNGRWAVSVHIPGDCDGNLSARLNDGRTVVCPIGYVTVGEGARWLFSIKQGACRSDVLYGNTASRKGG